ncbi:MAG: CocE/NonD family hydrolase [Pseudomonadota bacterium]
MSVLVEKNVAITMRDGTTLRGDVYRPNDSGKYPVLLQRTPYNKELWPITAMTLDPIRSAAAGYAVVIQDVRARWASEGEIFFPYRDEEDDGYDSIGWAASQSFASGKVGCYGLSYMGGTSWLAAASGHDALAAISPTTAPNDFWRNHFWRHGALNIGTLVMWALRAIGPQALMRAKPDLAEMYPLLIELIDNVDEFGEILRHAPMEELPAALPSEETFLPFFYEFLNHPAPDEWTDNLLFSDRHAQVKVPSLTIAGWHDLLLAADLEHFQGMRANGGSNEARQHSKLIVGPWAHASFLHAVGDIDFGFRANGMFLDLKEDLTKLQLRWFDRWLKGEKNGIEDEAPVKLFIQGENRWRDEHEWPLSRARRTRFYFREDGLLSNQAPPAGATPASYVYDPNEPCPTCGGNLLLPPTYVPGPVDQSPIIERKDVLSFIGPTLEADMEVTGQVRAVLYAATSGADTDWIVKLCDVSPSGATYNVCDGVLRASLRDGRRRSLLKPDAIEQYTIDLWSTAHLFNAGHRVRILITSSDFPRYDRNPNTGELAHKANQFEPALQRIFKDAARASYISLPIIAR